MLRLLFLSVVTLALHAQAEEKYPDFKAAMETCRFKSDTMVVGSEPLSDRVKKELMDKAKGRMDCDFKKPPQVNTSRDVIFVNGKPLNFIEVSY